MIAMSKKNNRSRALRSATSAVVEQIEPRIFLTATQTPFAIAPGIGIETTGPYTGSNYMADGESDPGATSVRTYSEFGYISIPIANYNPTYTVSTSGTAVSNLEIALDNSTTVGKYGPTAGTFDVYVLPDNDSNNGGPTTLTNASLVYGQPGDAIGSTNGGLKALGSTFGSDTSTSLNVTGSPSVSTASNGNYVGSYSITTTLALGYTTYTFSGLSSTIQSIIASDFNSANTANTPVEVAIVPETNTGSAYTTADPSAFADYYGSQAGETPTVSLNLNETPLPSVNETFATTFPSVSVNEVNTNKVVEVDVTRAGYTADSATLTYSTGGGTAVAGTNYTATTGTLTFAAGITQQEIAIPITEVGTTGFSGTKTFNVTLGTATPAPVAGLTITKSVSSTPTTVTIVGASGLPPASGASPADSVTDIEAGGPYYTTAAPINGSASNGSGNFGYQAYEVLDFSSYSTPNLYPATGTTLSAPTSLTLALDTNATYNTADLTTTTDPTNGLGEFNVYFVPPTSTTSTSSLTYSSGTVDGVNGQAGAILLGEFSYSGGSAGGFDSYTDASLSSTVAGDLQSDLNSGTAFRLIVAPGSSKFAGEFYGLLGASTPTVALADTPLTSLKQQLITYDAANTFSATEGASESIKVDRSGTDLTGTETVTYVTTDGNAIAGTNYDATSGVLSFGPGITSQTIVIPTIYLGAIKGDKAFDLTLSNVTLTGSDGGAVAVLGAGPQTVAALTNVVTIADANTSLTAHKSLGTVVADDAETIETTGAYYSTSSTHYFNVGGVYDPSNSPEYGALDFNDPNNAQSGSTFTPLASGVSITAINSLSLGVDQAGTDGVSGYLDVYLVSDDTAPIDDTVAGTATANTTTNGDKEIYDKVTTAGTNTGTTYPTAGFGHTGEVASTNGNDYTGTQFGSAYLLGNVYYNSKIVAGTYEQLPLIDFDTAAQTALITALQATSTSSSAGKFRLVIAPASNYVYADVNGNNADPNSANGYFLTPELTVNVAEGTATYPTPTPVTAPVNPAWLATSTGATVTFSKSAETLTVTSGSATIVQDPKAYGDLPKITVLSGQQLYVRPATNDVDIHIAGLTLLGTSTADVVSVGSGRSHSYHNVLVVGTLNSASDPTFSIASTAKLDLEDNDLIIHTGTSDSTGDTELGVLQAEAAEGRNVAPGGIYDGTWDGNGLASSAAATADLNAGYEQNILAVVLNSDMFLGGYGAWVVGTASETLGSNDIIVKYTYNGDLNLDGSVDGNAATVFSTFYDGGASVQNDYAFGDLNGDGKVDGNDATIFSTVFGNGSTGSGLPQL